MKAHMVLNDIFTYLNVHFVVLYLTERVSQDGDSRYHNMGAVKPELNYNRESPGSYVCRFDFFYACFFVFD